MKGFGIYVKNDLLDPKHYQKMGDAVWLFLWLLDKMTRIDYDLGEGLVLGGKPIKFEEVSKEIGFSRATYSRWVSTLVEAKYIAIKRTPYGLIFTVFKAEKIFGDAKKRSVKNEASPKELPFSDVAEPTNETSEVEASNKTIQKDNTEKRTTSAQKRAKFSEAGAEVLKAFEAVDPKNKTKYQNITERAACEFLLAEYGMEKVLKVIAILPKTNATPYMPTITSPYQLKEKWAALEASFRKKSDMPGRKPVIV